MIRVKTESGSVYVLDREGLTWARERCMPDVGALPVRTKTGKLNSFPDIEVGRPLVMFGPSLTPGGTVRVIETSPVTAVEED